MTTKSEILVVASCKTYFVSFYDPGEDRHGLGDVIRISGEDFIVIDSLTATAAEIGKVMTSLEAGHSVKNITKFLR